MIQVREYAILTINSQAESSLDCGIVSEATFDWLLNYVLGWKGFEGCLVIDNKRSLKLGSYVGYLQSPNGEGIEILPKTGTFTQEITKTRRILQDMLKVSFGVKPRTLGIADLMSMRQPLHEWIFSQFLNELQKLLLRGLRFDYQRVEEESRFIRGRLQVIAQQRQSAGREHIFQVSHNIYTPNRLENRLIKTALMNVLNSSRDNNNWRLANEFNHIMDEVKTIHNPLENLVNWRESKLLRHYESIKPWCQLILQMSNPNFQHGIDRGIALIFPMEKLFEKYVEHSLKKQLSLKNECHLHAQKRSKYLIKHTPQNQQKASEIFLLQPDLLLESTNGYQILDIKWKLLNESIDKYDISQSDLYQLFAYGHKYQSGKGHMMLIYPKHNDFNKSLPKFCYSDELVLWVVPFCLESRKLEKGEWMTYFNDLKE